MAAIGKKCFSTVEAHCISASDAGKCGEEAARRPFEIRVSKHCRCQQRALTMINFLSFVSSQRIRLKSKLARMLRWRWKPQKPQKGRRCGVGVLGTAKQA